MFEDFILAQCRCSISVEYGIASHNSDYLDIYKSKNVIELMEKSKHVVNINGYMNLYKVLFGSSNGRTRAKVSKTMKEILASNIINIHSHQCVAQRDLKSGAMYGALFKLEVMKQKKVILVTSLNLC